MFRRSKQRRNLTNDLLRSNSSADGIDVINDEQRIAVSLVGLKAKEKYSFALFTTPSRLPAETVSAISRLVQVDSTSILCFVFLGDPSAEIRKERSLGTS